jgi:hypothetical protein
LLVAVVVVGRPLAVALLLVAVLVVCFQDFLALVLVHQLL